MDKFISLADVLGVASPASSDPVSPLVDEHRYETMTGKEFSRAVLDSMEFRRYIVAGIQLGTIPPAILCRLIDHGWGKPPDRIEHTGKDGNPIETVTEVRRVIVRGEVALDEDSDGAAAPYTRH